MAGGIDLFAGGRSLTGANLFNVDRSPLDQLDTRWAHMVGGQNDLLSDISTFIQTILEALLQALEEATGLVFTEGPIAFLSSVIESLTGIAVSIASLLEGPLAFLGAVIASVVAWIEDKTGLNIDEGPLAFIISVIKALTGVLVEIESVLEAPLAFLGAIIASVVAWIEDKTGLNIDEGPIRFLVSLIKVLTGIEIDIDSLLEGPIAFFTAIVEWFEGLTGLNINEGPIAFLQSVIEVLTGIQVALDNVWDAPLAFLSSVVAWIEEKTGLTITAGPLEFLKSLIGLLTGQTMSFSNLLDGPLAFLTAIVNWIEDKTGLIITEGPLTFLQSLLRLLTGQGTLTISSLLDGPIAFFTAVVNWIEDKTGLNIDEGPLAFVESLISVLTGQLVGLGSILDAPLAFLTAVVQWIEQKTGLDIDSGPTAFITSLFGSLNFQFGIPTTNDNGLLDVGILSGLGDWARENVIVPIVTSFLTGMKVDLSKFGINSPADMANVSLGTLGDIAGSLLTSLTEVPAQLLSGLMPPGLLGKISVSNISGVAENLLTQGQFRDSTTVESDDGWSWDGSQNAIGGVGGSAKVVISSVKNRHLYSQQAVPVAKGDRLVLTAKVKTSSFSGTNPISIALIPYVGTVEQAPITIGSPRGSSTSWVAIGQAANTHYEVTSTTWTSVIVRLTVSSAATAGTVWFDEISLTKTGGLVQANVDSLVAAWNAAIGGLYGYAAPTSGNDWTGVFPAAVQARNQANSGVLKADNTNSLLGTSPQSLITNLFNVKADGSGTVGTLLGNLITTLKNPASSYGTSVNSLYYAAAEARTRANLGVTMSEGTNGVLFGTMGVGTQVRVEALPTDEIGAALTTTGSGALLIRNTTDLQDAGTSGQKIVPNGFFTEWQTKSDDIEVVTGNTGFEVEFSGWYMVELAYKLNPVASWGWNIAPILYHHTYARRIASTPSVPLPPLVVKYGTDCMYTWGGFPSFSSGAQRFVQNSFILYLETGDRVLAGYDLKIGATIGDRRVLGGGSGTETYFSISLLNRSYA